MEFIVLNDPNVVVFHIDTHPSDDNLALICFPGGSAVYDKADVERYFENGTWLKI